MRVFLSSTYEDLAEHRATVQASFDISGIDYNAMEHFGSTPTPPLQTCLDAVEASDTFVGVLGVRYGGCPPGRKRSYTEREYSLVLRRGMPIFIFLIDTENATVAPEWIIGETREQQERLRKLKEFIERRHTVTYFTTPEDLSRLILASLIREFGVLP